MRKLLIIVSGVFFSGFLWSLDPQKEISQYTLNTWKTEQGLPNNMIFSFAQDHAGYLWLGTADGLVRFDGVSFTVFNSRNTAEFRDDFVNNLYIDRRGALWIGTLRGNLLSLERGVFKTHFLSATISSFSYYCIAEDGRGNLWVGTSEGLFHRPPGDSGPFKKCRLFPGIQVACLAKDHSGRLLVATTNRNFYRQEDGQWRRVLPDADRLGGDISVISQGRNGCVWLGTEDGLYGFHGQRLLHYPFQRGMANNIVSLAEDRDGNLWVGSEGGLYRRSRDAFQSLDVNQGLSGNIVYSLAEDAEGSLWVGTVDGGLVQIRDEKMTALTNREGLGGKVLRCLHGDEAGALWIGGRGSSLNRYDHGRCEQFPLPARFENIEIWALERDDEGSFWLGTSLGVLHFRAGRFREIPLPGPNPNVESRCILKDRSGRLWVGTQGAGLLCRQQGTFRQYAKNEGLPDDRIASLFEDRSGNLWVGCESGMAVMSPGSPGRFIQEPLFADCHVVSIYEDAQGTIWGGTRNQGLKVLQGGRRGSLNSDRGLFDNRVYAILEDDLGHLWMSSERGVFRASKRELEKAAFDPSQKVRGRVFDENDGMKSRIGNIGSPAAWKGDDGRLWFANLAGAVSIDPAHIRNNGRVPPVLVEKVVVDGRRQPLHGISLLAPLKLTAGSRRFEFKYTALSFIRSDKIAFKYKLEGYDRDWIAAGGRRQAFYNDLRPGSYRFRVIAANADGAWNRAGASFAFFLRPFVYQTWWFLVLAVLAFAALSVFAWQMMKRYLRAISFWKKKTVIGHFKILETIGCGGMATVYKAQDLLDRRRVVALKVLSDENFGDEDRRKRFKHEALITEQLDHPHIVHIIERGEMEGCWYIAMELLPGLSLARMIRERGRPSLADALEIMRQVIDALKAIHAKEIVHRDLKPENIMVCSWHGGGPFVKLLDFGLAITPAQSRLTMSGIIMGTIRYLPPERIDGGISSAPGDIYSAGIILYEMLTGAKPFWSEATGEVVHRILETYPLPVREIVPAVPPELDDLVAAMIDKDPARRPSLDRIESEIKAILDSLAAAGEPPAAVDFCEE